MKDFAPTKALKVSLPAFVRLRTIVKKLIYASQMGAALLHPSNQTALLAIRFRGVSVLLVSASMGMDNQQHPFVALSLPQCRPPRPCPTLLNTVLATPVPKMCGIEMQMDTHVESE